MGCARLEWALHESGMTNKLLMTTKPMKDATFLINIKTEAEILCLFNIYLPFIFVQIVYPHDVPIVIQEDANENHKLLLYTHQNGQNLKD